MRYLQPYHIPHCIPRQIKWLAPKQVVHIRSSSQIYQEDESGPLYFLSKNQLKDLQDSQSELIPLSTQTTILILIKSGKYKRYCLNFLTVLIQDLLTILQKLK